jgi:hypothetical protein
MSEVSSTSSGKESLSAAGGSALMRKVSLVLIVIGGALSLAGFFADGDQFSHAYLWGFAFVWVLVLGSLFFVALHHITRAVWSVVIRRIAEMFASPVWVLAICFVPVLVFLFLHEQFALFPWADPEVVANDKVLQGKSPYLNTTFFLIRAAFFFLVWIGFTRFYLRRSIGQDTGEAGEEATARMRKWSGPIILLFALTMTFASFDWIMSLEPHWFSTIFGVYIFAGMVVTSLSAIIITVISLRAKGRLGSGIVTNEHLYSLGGLLFAFTCFWAYIAFSQFMLIWYGNLPEETVYFVHRVEHGWLAISLVLILLRFALPFLMLLSRPAKMNPRRLVAASIVCIIGELVDLYWMIMPQFYKDGPGFGWAPLLLLSGLLLLSVHRFMSRHRPLAEGDPFFKQSCEFHL